MVEDFNSLSFSIWKALGSGQGILLLTLAIRSVVGRGSVVLRVGRGITLANGNDPQMTS